MGNADSYLDAKKLPARKKWSADSHKRKYENDWVVDILEGGANDDFELGYDYHTCGICSLCRDEGCFELAKYLCRMDYVLADMMHMRLVRTQQPAATSGTAGLIRRREKILNNRSPASCLPAASGPLRSIHRA